MEQYFVTGMSCAACQARVEKTVSKVPGVTGCSVSLLTNSMGVEGSASSQAIISAVEAAGYGASLKTCAKTAGNAASAGEEALKDRETPILRKRLIASVILLIPLLYLSMGHMMWGWPLPAWFDGNHVAMSLSSFCVVSNALRLNFVRLRGKEDNQTLQHIPEVKTVSAAQAPRVRMELTIDGMMCKHCEARVQKALESISGVIHAKADHQTGQAIVQAEQVIDEALLRQAVEAEDYLVTGIHSL